MKKIARKLISSLCITLLLVQSLATPFLVSPVYAATSPWTQTDWSGGSGQTSWSDNTKFDSSSSVTTSTAGQATLTNTEEFTNTGFETDMSGWTASTANFLLQDEFTTTASAPLTSPRTAEPGPGTLTITDTTNKLSILNSKAVFNLNTFGDPALWSTTSFTRTAGRASISKVVLSTTDMRGQYGFDTNQSGGSGGGAYLLDNATISILSPSQINVGLFTTQSDAFLSIARTSGYIYISRTNGVWSLDWVDKAITTTPIYAYVSGPNFRSGFSLDFLRVTDLPAPFTDDYGIATQRLAGARSNGDTFTHEANAVIEFTATAVPTGGVLWMEFRKQSNGNNWVTSINAARDLTLFENVNGTLTQRGSAAAVVQNGHRVVVVADGTTIRGYSNNVLRWTYSSASNFSTSTEGTMGITGTGGAVSDIVTWPRTLSGSAATALDTVSADNTITVSQSTAQAHSGTNSAKVIASNGAQAFTSSVNVGDTNQYNLTAYAYTDASAVTSADAELYYNGSTVSTTYTSVGSGWYQLTGTVTGANASRDYGVQVKAGKTVYLDDMSLNSYASSGTVTSSIFDTEFTSGSAWGTLTYTSSGSTVAVKARTSNSSSMTGATDFSSCTAITSASDISSNSCVTDGHKYIQYQLALSTSDTSSTPTFSDISTTFAVYDSDAPSISLTALSPDSNNDNTPTLSGTATDSIGTVSNVQFQMDATSGSWTACTATDAAFDEASETFSCTAATLTDGSHTMYVRVTDSNSNTTSNASASTDTFTIDATAPASIDLDSPGNNSYTNSERPTFKWKATTDATAGLSKYVLEIDNPSIGSGQPSGDFTIDDIPTSRTTDYETNRYVIHYENFSDSDATNNYISVYTKSSSEWSTDSTSGQNDGKVREGKVSWKVKARDNAGNETSSSRTLFVDRTNPKMKFTQVNDYVIPAEEGIQTGSPIRSGMTTNDKTPTIYGKITDSLVGGDSSQTQDDNGPKVASGPKQVDIKVEKKEGLTYKLHTLYTINMDTSTSSVQAKPWYTCDSKEVTDNSKQKCDKYLPFDYTVKDNLELGSYKITITGKDKADNSSSETSFTLNISTLSEVITPQEEEIIDEEILKRVQDDDITKEEGEQIKEELEITKPTEEVPISALEKATSVIPDLIGNLYKSGTAWIPTFVGMTKEVATGIGNGVKTVASTVWSGITFTGGKITQGATALGKTTQTMLATVGQSISNTATSIGEGYNQLANNAPGVAKTILTGIGNGVSTTTNFIASATSTVATTTVTIAQNTGKTIASATNAVVTTTTTVTKNTGSTIANVTKNTVDTSKEGIANVAFFVGEKTQNVSDTAGFSIVKFGYVFVDEPTTISDVQVATLSSTSVKVSWETNHPANGKVNWGYEDGIYEFEDQTDKRTTRHEFVLTNLKPDTEYHYEVMSHNKNYVYDANRKFRTPTAL